MANKNFSPEKRLLQIIESQEKTDDSNLSPINEAKKIVSPSFLKAKFSFLLSRLKNIPGKSTKLKLELETINNVLQVLIVAGVIILGISVTLSFNKLNKGIIIKDNELEANAEINLSEIVSLLKPVEYYLEKIKKRDLFSLETAAEVKKGRFKDAEEPGSWLAERVKDLNLVGISWSQDPDAIIEDKKFEQTYFVKKGYMIDEIEVYEVLEDRVVLRARGDKIELK
ncbi:MAG: hypothetical protein ABIG64_10550 [Candidatus Omnitrophota bacterium]